MKPKILSHFSTMEDPRIERGKIHPLENIIFISISAIICGAETWDEIEDFGIVKSAWLYHILDMKEGVPSHDTFNRFFQLLDPKEFEKHFRKWVQSIIGKIDCEYVSIDGKTVRQASKMTDNACIHIVNAWANLNEVTLGQIKTDNKSNEITAIPQLLETLLLENCIVTIDVMGCQKAIAAKIRERKADYILAVKENQAQLYNDIMSSFSMLEAKEFSHNIEIDHGRIETRKYSLISNLKYISGAKDWKDIKSIVRVESERIIKKTGETSSETRYYIASIDDIEQASKGIRLHWGIENKLHWTLDVTMNEDKSAKREGYAAQNFSLLSKLVLNLLKQDDRKISIRRKRKIAGWDTNYLCSILASV